MKNERYKNAEYFIRHLRIVEYVLDIIDNDSEDITVKQIKTKIKEKFKILPVPDLLSHRFIPFQLLSILLIKDEGIKCDESDELTISIIRHSIAHNDFKFDAEKATFINKKKDENIIFTYPELEEFIMKIENIYFKEKFSEERLKNLL